jgi:AAA+ ATPase superfamily predicted ATPase
MPGVENISFNTIEAVFDFIDKNVKDDKLVLVIDELPYWAEKDDALLSVLQKYIDTIWNDKNLKIILCGSALSFMEKKVLSEKSPLFGRRDSQIKLEAFSYLDAAEFVPDYSNEDKAICYGITGGVARYLAMIDPEKSIDENIVRLFFRTDGYLYDETRNLLTQEFSDISIVNNIVEQIASGENTLNIIAGKIGEKEQTVLYSLDKLINVGLVEKKKCITDEKNKKKTQYVLKDYMFKFWYEFIPKATSVIEIGQGELYYTKVVKPALHSFMGTVFEDMCRYYTLKQGIEGAYGCFITSVGSWWGTESITDKNGGVRTQSTDIDVVAISEIDKKAVIGECKFKNEKIDKGVYETLIRRGKLITAKYKVSKYIFFSLSGYTDWFKSLSDNDVLLLTVDSLYEKSKL